MMRKGLEEDIGRGNFRMIWSTQRDIGRGRCEKSRREECPSPRENRNARGRTWCYTKSSHAVAALAARTCGMKELAGFKLAASIDSLRTCWETHIRICSWLQMRQQRSLGGIWNNKIGVEALILNLHLSFMIPFVKVCVLHNVRCC